MLAVLFALGCALAAQAADRVALIIGNGQYEAVAGLSNPENDAADLAAAFRRLGFEVSFRLNLDNSGMRRALRDFSRQAEEAEFAVLYFAGHGLEIDKQNYVLPVDARIERAQDALYEANSLSQLIGAVAGAESLRLVLLDACRNNPFLVHMADASTRSLGRGLSRIEPPGGVLVGYAAKGGTVAYDGDGRNSPYARALLANLETPGLEIGKLFRRVRDDVYNQTDGLQEPFTYGSLPARDIYLAAARPEALSERDMFRAFAEADLENTVEGWTGFIDRFAALGLNDTLVDRARQKRRALLNPQPAASAPAVAGSPLIRACDGLAADPEDESRPADVPGIAAGAVDVPVARQACALAAVGHPDHARSLYQLARTYIIQGSFPAARPYLKQAAAHEYMAAQIALADTYFADLSDRSNTTTAVELLERATRNGSAIAPRKLAGYRQTHVFFLGTPAADAAELYALAARRGDLPAMYQTGFRLLSRMDPSPEDLEQGARYLETAAAAGDGRAVTRLVNFYLSRSDAAQRDRARALLEQAAQDGDRAALDRLIREYRTGAHWSRDPVQAMHWVKFAATTGRDSRRMVEYGYALETGRGVVANPVQAALYYVQAVAEGNTDPIRRAALDWDRETAREVQKKLGTLNVSQFSGPVDGVIGRGTRAALERVCRCSARGASLRFSDRFAQ